MTNNVTIVEKKVFFWIAVGIMLGIVLKLFAVDVLRVSGNSMEPSLCEGSHVVVNKLAYGIVKPGSREFFVQWKTPEVDDVVIYLHDNKIVVKRCVAVGGDALEYFADNEYTLIVGEKNIALTEYQYRQLKSIDKVTDGYIFAVGDNYNQSIDSRSYGFVSTKNVVGKVVGK